MIEKDYYRLSELERDLNISNEDVLYWIENNLVRFVIPRPQAKYIYGGYHKENNNFIGCGVAYYKGLIRVSKQEESRIFKTGKGTVYELRLIDADLIVHHSANYEFEVPLPNGFMELWQAIDDIPFLASKLGSTPPKLYPSDGKKTWELVKSALESMSTNQPKEVPDDALLAQPIAIKKEELCITHADLIRLGQLSNDEPQATIDLSPTDSKKFLNKPKFENDFDALLYRVLSDNPNIRNKAVIKALTEDAETEEDARKYDDQNILVDEVDGVLGWRDRFGTVTTKHYTQKTIFNRLSEVRKLLS